MKICKKILLTILILFLLFMTYFSIGNPPEAEKITWGVSFSQKHSRLLGLDFKENYLSLLDDLKVKNIRLITHWDLLEPQKGEFHFEDLDWQIEKASEKGVNLILVIGRKTPRWPECHVPEWANSLSKEEQQKEILELLERIVLRYQNQSSIKMWQVENEPLFPYGNCPWLDREFLKREIELVRSLDNQKRPVFTTESGEWSFWVKGARLGDLVGISMYKKVWFQKGGFYVWYPFTPVFYWRKADFIKRAFNKKVMVTELQAEPWGPSLLYDSPLKEQEKTMNLEKFKYNIEFAKKTGFDTIYLWGAEWWYWLKEKHNDPRIWNEAKKLFESL